MTRTRKKILLIAAAVLAVAWLALFYSNRALLVWASAQETRLGPKFLTCHYFTGTGLVEREHLSLKGIGKDYCPRWIRLD